MKRYAVIGQPVAHSLSPRIHADFAGQTARTIEYIAQEVAPDQLADTLSTWHADPEWMGSNVTLPHKTSVVSLCSEITERARVAGAVNTLIRADEGWLGDNTDGEGLLRDLRDNLDIPIRDRRVLVLGAGGAACGILAPLLEQQPTELVLSNRSPWKPEAIAERFQPVGRIRPCTHLALKGDCFDVVINAMSVGHGGTFPRLPDDLLADDAVAYDLSYGAAHGVFADWARSAGASAIHDGLGMLVEQAAVSYERWHGVLPQTDAVIDRMRGEG